MHDNREVSVPPFTSFDWDSVQVRLLLDDARVSFTVALKSLIRVIVIVEFA